METDVYFMASHARFANGNLIKILSPFTRFFNALHSSTRPSSRETFALTIRRTKRAIAKTKKIWLVVNEGKDGCVGLEDGVVKRENHTMLPKKGSNFELNHGKRCPSASSHEHVDSMF